MNDRPLARIIGTVLLSGLLQTGTAETYLVSDFDDGIPDWDGEGGAAGEHVESGGQLSLRARLPATVGNLANSSMSLGWAMMHIIADEFTFEYRVDLIRTSRADVLAGLEFNCLEQGIYALFLSQTEVFLHKAYYGSGFVPACLFHDSLPLSTSNVVLSLALTRVNDSLRITTRLLDKGENEVVLFERTVIDTPGIDPTVDQAPRISNLQPDPGPPYFNGVNVWLHVAQVTDGNQPEAEVVYDNFTYSYGRNVKLMITKKAGNEVCLAWPILSTPLIVEEAPGVDTLWAEVVESPVPLNGTNYLTVPISAGEPLKLFRLREVTNP